MVFCIIKKREGKGGGLFRERLKITLHYIFVEEN
jgi:hypothetical protein